MCADVARFAGFLGALVTTLLAALWFSRYLAQYQWLVCPRKDLTILKWLHCEPANTFRALPATETFAPLPGFVRHAVLSVLPEGFTIMPLQLHAVSFAVRAPLLALSLPRDRSRAPRRFLCSCLPPSLRPSAASSPRASSARCG